MHASQDAHKHIWTLLPILSWQKQAKEFCYSLESSEKVSHTVCRRAHMPKCFQYLYLINHMSGVTLLFNITVLHWSPTQRWVWSIQVSLSLSKSPVFHRSIQSSILFITVRLNTRQTPSIWIQRELIKHNVCKELSLTYL